MTVQRKPLPGKIKLFIVVTSMDFKVSREVVCAECSGYESILTSFQYVLDVRK